MKSQIEVIEKRTTKANLLTKEEVEHRSELLADEMSRLRSRDNRGVRHAIRHLDSECQKEIRMLTKGRRKFFGRRLHYGCC